MRVIYKYVVPLGNDYAMHEVPVGAVVCLVGTDPRSGQPAFWAVVDANAPEETREFIVVGTGQFFGIIRFRA